MHNGHQRKQPHRNAVNNFSDDIYYVESATFCAQLSNAASFDVRGFDAASDVTAYATAQPREEGVRVQKGEKLQDRDA